MNRDDIPKFEEPGVVGLFVITVAFIGLCFGATQAVMWWLA